jgi:hypothetical protein
MSEKKEYILEKDAKGNLKFTPKNNDSGGTDGMLILVFITIIIVFAFITLPLGLAILGVSLNNNKKHEMLAYTGSILMFIYFIFDVQNKWITGWLFLGYTKGNGILEEPLMNERFIYVIYVLNIIGLIWSIYNILTVKIRNNRPIDDTTAQ